MKKNFVYLFTILLVVACAEQKKMIVFGDKDNQVSFKNIDKSLTDIKQGDIVEFEYEFTNTGKSKVLILNAVPTCGCVRVEYPKTPIPPKEKAKIQVAFDSEGKTGVNKKSIVVQTNLAHPNDIIELSFKVEVKAKQ